MLDMLLKEPIYQLSQVKTAGHMPLACPQIKKALAILCLRYDIQVAPNSQLQLTVAEEFQVTSELTGRATYSFSYRLDLPMRGSEECYNAVGLTEVDPLEDNRSGGVATLLPHALESLTIKKT
uniref:Uncharacterized protein n=1 Tax=Thermogemmatispora argillosa TaxID=2045280 RepID=A0A455T5W0_9CHLR|nr:hypothetical protein KTA_28700 [Thermogemmatispora argillosa]